MKKSLLACTIFPVALLMASAQAAAATITVTTTADQDGNDTANCSLREAIVAVNRSQAYGGCPAGIFRAQNTIQLKSGTYLLDSELMVSQEVTIRGADTFRRIGDGFGTTEGNVLTGSEVSRLQPLTIIKPAVGKNIRLINAAAATSGVELVDLVLEGGNPSSAEPSLNYGGAILTSASLVLDNVRMRGNTASRGGAIYLGGTAGLVASDSEFSGNKASLTGAVVAMGCYADGVVSRTVSVSRSSFRLNEVAAAAVAGAGVMQMCGNMTASFSSSTFSANTSTAGAGALHFKDDLASLVSLTFEHVTAAENSGSPVIASAGAYKWTLRKSVFAANTGGNCAVTDANADCTVVDPLATSSNYAADNVVVSGDLSVFAPAGFQRFGGLTGGYLPAVPSSIHDVVMSGCRDLDQRGIGRESVQKCDVGALERLQFSAADDRGTNKFGEGRIARVDVLANDSYEEDGSATPVIAKPVAFGIVNKSASEVSNSLCAIDAADPVKPLLVVDNLGQVTSSTASIKCYYQLKDGGGGLVGNIATVDVSIVNFKPVARDDVYQRSVGVTEVILDILANDDDEGDGESATARNSLAIMIRGERMSPGVVKTQLGSVIGTERDCQDATGDAVEGAVCFAAGTLVYRADNSISPFTEEFEYSIYDSHPGEEPVESNKAKVTIATDAPEAGTTGGGAFDWLLLCVGVLLSGLRLSRRL